MGVAFISEYTSLVEDTDDEVVSVASEPSLVTQAVTFTTSTQSAAFSLNPRTKFIRIICDSTAHFAFGTNPTATSSSPLMAANTAEYFGLALGGTWKVAFYDGSS